MRPIDPDVEKAMLGSKGLLDFCDQFGRDIYTQIFLEELLEGIIHEENVFVFGEPEQTGNQIDHGSSGGESSGFETRRLKESSVASDMGKKDISNYP